MRSLSRFAVVALLAVPLFAGAVTVDELRAQAAELLARIAALQQQLGATPSVSVTTSSPTACPQLGQSLKRGSTGEDVTRLQQFLARDSSVYPEAQVTGYYGALTEAAVKRWQVKFNIVSSGTPESTGYGVVGPRTAAILALQCAGATSTGASGSGTPSVGGFIQVTPIAGNAPLSVAVQATVNTVNSCAGSAYTLDYGDGTVPSQIAVPAGNCQQMTQTLGHSYPYGGTYQITLSAGAHRTSATVVVYGAGPTATPVTPATQAPEPKGSISAFVTTGVAPFNANFYISCVGGTAYNVVFGDGQDLGSANVAKTTCGGLQAASHTYTSAGTYTAQLIVFVQQTDGTITPKSLGSVSITVTGSGGSGGSGGTQGGMTITPGAGGNPLAVEAQFQMTTYAALDWGDGSPGQISHTLDCGDNCPVTTKTFNHTYALSGTYTITLTRGSQTDTASISISN